MLSVDKWQKMEYNGSIMKKWVSRIVHTLVILYVILLGITLYANWVILKNKSDIITEITELPNYPIALVLGAGMDADGTMTDLQEDRVIQGINLYKSGKVKKLLMTADDGRRWVNEVDAMREYAIAAGVPQEDILMDRGGIRTYASCRNAREVFALDKVIAISQSFHLPRIIYLCKAMGIETVGYPADLRPYDISSVVWTIDVREVLARVKAWVEVGVLDKTP